MVFILAIIGMICWGLAPIFVKLGLANVNPLVGLSIRTIITAVMIFSWMIFDGSITQLKNINTNVIFLLTIEAILATLIGDLAYFAAIKKGSVSLVTIVMSCSPLVTIICATIFFHEAITMMKVLGAGLIILGIILVV